MEVSVGPEDGQVSIDKYPYFLDFEPKKKELYELVTSTGETMTRSLSNVEIGKSNTTLMSHEVADIDKGWSLEAELKVKDKFEAGAAGSREGEWGSRNINKEASKNSKNTEASQEMRETQSHSTQLSQMYHQLNSYHLGTNRAVFFIHPRPHTLETVHTFVNGPRNIEGIQDFIFVVARPKDMEKICVEAYLETGHIDKEPRTVSVEVPGTEKTAIWQDKFSAKPLGNDDETTVYDDKDRIWEVEDYNPGYKIKDAVYSSPGGRSRHVNADPPSNLVDIHPHISVWNEDFVKVSGKVHSSFKNYGVGNDRWEEIDYPFTVTITLVKTQHVEKTTDTLFITGRRLCCCPMRFAPFKEGVIYEKQTASSSAYKAYPSLVRKETQPNELMPIQVANAMSADIRQAIIDSRTDTENRYQNFVKLPQTDFATQSLLKIIDEDEGHRFYNISKDNLSESVKTKLENLNEKVSIKYLLSLPFKALADIFDFSEEEVVELRNALTGINREIKDKRKAWLSDEELQRLFRGEKEKNQNKDPKRKDIKE